MTEAPAAAPEIRIHAPPARGEDLAMATEGASRGDLACVLEQASGLRAQIERAAWFRADMYEEDTLTPPRYLTGRSRAAPRPAGHLTPSDPERRRAYGAHQGFRHHPPSRPSPPPGRASARPPRRPDGREILTGR
jgi:hypothetical protein